MADLTAAERIAAEALASSDPECPDMPASSRASVLARRAVAALSAAGWLVEPAAWVNEDGRSRNLTGYEPCVVGSDGRCSRWGHRHEDEPVSPAGPGTAPPAPSPP
jgi:hypothetical protein